MGSRERRAPILGAVDAATATLHIEFADGLLVGIIVCSRRYYGSRYPYHTLLEWLCPENGSPCLRLDRFLMCQPILNLQLLVRGQTTVVECESLLPASMQLPTPPTLIGEIKGINNHP